jgi:hypothetical protein
MTTRWIGLMTLALGVLVVLPDAHAFPWEKEHKGDRHRGDKVAEKIKAKRAELIRTRIGLDEAAAQTVLETLERFDTRRHTLMQRKQQLRTAVGALFESDSEDESKYESALAEWEAIEIALHAMRKEQHAALRKVVSARYQLRIFVALKRFNRKLHHGLEKRRERHRGLEGKRGDKEGRRKRGDRRGRRGR